MNISLLFMPFWDYYSYSFVLHTCYCLWGHDIIPRYVVTISDLHVTLLLTTDQIDVLKLGQIFTLTPKQNNQDLQADIDEFSRKLRLEEYRHNRSSNDNGSIVRNKKGTSNSLCEPICVYLCLFHCTLCKKLVFDHTLMRKGSVGRSCGDM
jgi:hypothetical protein